MKERQQQVKGKVRLEQDKIFNASSSFGNFEIKKYYQNKPKFNGVYSRNNSPKIKDEVYVINLDKYKSIATHWIALYVNGNNRRASYDAIYFDSFGVEHIPKEIKKFIVNKTITNIYRIQAYDWIMCRYFCIGLLCEKVRAC